MDKISFDTIISIPFYDVDSLNIVWHGNYVKYLEDARCNLLDLIDYDYQEMLKSGYAWPIIDLKVKYIKPIAFKQKILITAILESYDSYIEIKYLIKDYDSKQTLTKASTKQVAIDISTKEMQLYAPKILLQKIEKYKGRD